MVELYPHQLKAIGEMHNGSVLQGGVGTGKSRTALAYYVKNVCGAAFRINGTGEPEPMDKPRDCYVVTTAKKRDSKDWEQEAAAFSISSDPWSSIGEVGFHVISWNELPRYAYVRDAFFIFDEQRVVGSGTWAKTFIALAKTNAWILLSATPGDTWMDYIPIFVAHGFYKNRTEFLRTHVVFKAFSKFPSIDHYVEVNKLERLKRSIVIDMPYARHTVRHVQNIMVSYDKTRFDLVYTKRWHIYEERAIRDVGEMFTVMRKLVNSDVARMAAVMELAEIHSKLIIFYSFDYELEIIRQLTDILDIDTAEWNGHKHQEVPLSSRWLYLVQYQAGAEGWNCVTTDAMVFWSLTYSYKLFEQAKGRIDRLNTTYTDLHYYVLRSSSVIDNAITRSLAGKKDFNEKEFLRHAAV